MDASFGLGQSKQTDENQQEGERASQKTWGSSVWAAADRPLIGSDQGRWAFFCGMIQTDLVLADREELSQVILN